MKQLIRALILRAPGTNCDEETAHAFSLAGAEAVRLHVNELVKHAPVLSEFQILCLPGGFSYGDDLGSGKVLGQLLRLTLRDSLQRFRDRGGLILGICNGFQVLLQTDLLIGRVGDLADAALTHNLQHRYEARWTRVAFPGEKCVFTRGLPAMELPIAHGEGRLVVRDDQIVTALQASGRACAVYVTAENQPALTFPENPSGTVAGIAGLCDETGRVFGLMPHPERFLWGWQHPSWTRDGSPVAAANQPGAGLRLFQNAVRNLTQ